MQFQSTQHRNKFKYVMRTADQGVIENPGKYEACCYLLTADSEVWNIAKAGVTPDDISFDHMYMNDAGVVAYTLIKCASDIFCGTGYTTVYDLCETEELTPSQQKAIFTAILMSRYGGKNIL